MIAAMMANPSGGARANAAPEDENQWILVFLGVVAACAAIAAIIWELGAPHALLAHRLSADDNWLPDEEAAQLRFEFETEIPRLEAA